MRLLIIIVFATCVWVQPPGRQAIPLLYEYNTTCITVEPCRQQLIPACNYLKIGAIGKIHEKGAVRQNPSQQLEVAETDSTLYKAEPVLVLVHQHKNSPMACTTNKEDGYTAPGFPVFQPPKLIA